MLLKLPPLVKGSARSGNYGHAGRPGQRGGSASVSGGGASSAYRESRSEGAKNADWSMRNTAEAYGMSAEQVESEVYEWLSSTIEANDVAIRMPASAASKMLSDGSYKNQFEIGKSKGLFDPEWRKRAERNGLDVDEEAPAKERPVYGYINSPEVGRGEVTNYGPVEIRLKDSVKNRSTVTLGDSLKGFGFGTRVGTPAHNPTKESWNNRTQPALKERQFLEYIEVQVSGGVQRSDIASIRLGSGAYKEGKLMRSYQTVANKADKFGIEVIYDPERP